METPEHIVGGGISTIPQKPACYQTYMLDKKLRTRFSSWFSIQLRLCKRRKLKLGVMIQNVKALESLCRQLLKKKSEDVCAVTAVEGECSIILVGSEKR